VFSSLNHSLILWEIDKKMAQVWFESFSTPAIFIAESSLCSVIGGGSTTGLAIDIGHSGCNVVPVYESKSMKNCSTQGSVGGDDINDELRKLLVEANVHFNMLSNIGKLFIKDIKEKHGFVSLNPMHDEERLNLKKVGFEVIESGVSSEIQLGPELFKCTEILFDGSEKVGCGPRPTIQELVQNALNHVENPSLVDTLCKNIVLSGGTSRFPGLKERVQNEVSRSINKQCGFVDTIDNRTLLPWLGASTWAKTISSFSGDYSGDNINQFMNRQEYDEYGSFYINYKCKSPYFSFDNNNFSS